MHLVAPTLVLGRPRSFPRRTGETVGGNARPPSHVPHCVMRAAPRLQVQAAGGVAFVNGDGEIVGVREQRTILPLIVAPVLPEELRAAVKSLSVTTFDASAGSRVKMTYMVARVACACLVPITTPLRQDRTC